MTNLNIKRDEKKRKIWSHVRNKWLVETPEETVRQQYLLVLVNDYGFSLDQIDEELNLMGRGSASARADFVIWRTVKDKADSNAPFIVVECKSDNVTIKPHDYSQGENYARRGQLKCLVPTSLPPCGTHARPHRRRPVRCLTTRRARSGNSRCRCRCRRGAA
jgi:hypothetical protein